MNKQSWTEKAKALIERHESIIRECNKHKSAFYMVKRKQSLEIIEFLQAGLNLVNNK
jgi:hypothetical protein